MQHERDDVRVRIQPEKSCPDWYFASDIERRESEIGELIDPSIRRDVMNTKSDDRLGHRADDLVWTIVAVREDCAQGLVPFNEIPGGRFESGDVEVTDEFKDQWDVVGS